MEVVISDRILEKEREKKKRKTAILLSLIAHLFVLNVIVFLPHKNHMGGDDFVKIDWMQEVPKERLRRMQVKPKVKPAESYLEWKSRATHLVEDYYFKRYPALSNFHIYSRSHLYFVLLKF